MSDSEIELPPYAPFFSLESMKNQVSAEYNRSEFSLLNNVEQMQNDFTNLNVIVLSKMAPMLHNRGIIYLKDSEPFSNYLPTLTHAISRDKFKEHAHELPPLFLFDPTIPGELTRVLNAFREYSGSIYEDVSPIEPSFDMGLKLRIKDDRTVVDIHSGLRYNPQPHEIHPGVKEWVRVVCQDGWTVHIGIDYHGTYLGLDFDIRENLALQYALTPYNTVLETYAEYIRTRYEALTFINSKKLRQPGDWCYLVESTFAYDQVKSSFIYLQGKCPYPIIVKEQGNKFKRRVGWYLDIVGRNPVKAIDVWVEGHHSQDSNPVKARYLGWCFALNLKQALDILNIPYRPPVDDRLVDDYGCRYFDNETDARKSFG